MPRPALTCWWQAVVGAHAWHLAIERSEFVVCRTCKVVGGIEDLRRA